VVRETSSRDRYRKLKRDITAKLTYERCSLLTAGVGKTSASYRTALTKAALLPLTAVALPTIRESTDLSKRALSDPQTPRSGSLVAPTPPVYCRVAGRSVRPSLRPCLTTLPMRSWKSDDSNYLTSCVTGNEVTTCNRRETKRDRLCRNARVDEMSPSSSVVSPPTIPIIISSPDDCENERLSANKSCSELLSAQRRLSCPLSTYDVNSTETDNTSTPSVRLKSSTSRKRSRDTSERRPSLQLITAPKCQLVVDEKMERWPTGCTGAEQQTDRHDKYAARPRLAAVAAAAAAACVNGECHSSSLDVHWSPRRLSLPHSSTSVG